MTITKQDVSIVLDTDKPWEKWACYEHHVTFDPNAPPDIIMIGVCKLTDVYRMSEGRVNSEWMRIFARGGHVMVRIVAIGDDKVEMTRWASSHMRGQERIPRCNLHGVNQRGYSRPVRCENTGEVYESQREACEALGLHQSAMSRHLSGAIGKVGGMMFRYVNEEVARS